MSTAPGGSTGNTMGLENPRLHRFERFQLCCVDVDLLVVWQEGWTPLRVSRS